jgi:hypothetical protein
MIGTETSTYRTTLLPTVRISAEIFILHKLSKTNQLVMALVKKIGMAHKIIWL